MSKRHGKHNKNHKEKTPRCKYCGVKMTKYFTQGGTGGLGLKRNSESTSYWVCQNRTCSIPKEENEEG